MTMSDDDRDDSNPPEKIDNHIQIPDLPDLTDERWKEIEAETREHEASARSQQRDQRLSLAAPALTESGRNCVINETMRPTAALIAVQRWWSTPKPILILGGAVGSGKTVAGSWMLLERLGGISVQAWQVYNYFDVNYSDNAREVERLIASTVLFMDDLGREKDPLRMRRYLCDLLDARRDGHRRTLITTNASKKQFNDAYYDKRLMSRLRESAVWANASGRDLREGKGWT